MAHSIIFHYDLWAFDAIFNFIFIIADLIVDFLDSIIHVYKTFILSVANIFIVKLHIAIFVCVSFCFLIEVEMDQLGFDMAFLLQVFFLFLSLLIIYFGLLAGRVATREGLLGGVPFDLEVQWRFLVAAGGNALDESAYFGIDLIDAFEVAAAVGTPAGLAQLFLELHLARGQPVLVTEPARPACPLRIQLLQLELVPLRVGRLLELYQAAASECLREAILHLRHLRLENRPLHSLTTTIQLIQYYQAQPRLCSLSKQPQSGLSVAICMSGGLRAKVKLLLLQFYSMDALLREKMTQLTTKCEILQKNGKYVECIDIMEEIVSIKKNVYGIDHAEFESASEKLCEYLNLAAMIHLQKEKFELTLDYLRKAELVARDSLVLKATTYNNLACYYRRTGKVRTALSYLIQALDLELKLDQPKTLADTHLNLCAVLSQLDRHEDALQHSMLSIILLQDEFLSTLLPKVRSLGEEEVNDERLAVLAIAYHNLGVEFEHLKRFEQALKIYRKALSFSKENLSNNEQLVKNLTKVVNSATEQIEEQKRSLLANVNKTMVMKDSTLKNDLYKDLSKKVERYRPLPRLRVNGKEHAALYEPAYQSVDYNDEEPANIVNASKTLKNRQKFLSQRITTKHQNAITPDSRGQLDSELKVRPGMNITSHDKDFSARLEQQ